MKKLSQFLVFVFFVSFVQQGFTQNLNFKQTEKSWLHSPVSTQNNLLNPQNSELSFDSKRGNPENVVKLNLPSIPLVRGIYVTYERVLTDVISVDAGANFMLKGQIPGFMRNFLYNVVDRSDVDSLKAIDLIDISGFAFTGSVRFYTGGEAPTGFYVSPYFRYSKLNVTGQYTYLNSNTNAAEVAIFQNGSSLKSVGLGVLLGNQWLINDKVALDFWILGLGASKSNLFIEVTGEDGTIDMNDFEEIKSEIEKTLGDIGDLSSEVTDSRANFDLDFWRPSFRFGFSVGIAL